MSCDPCICPKASIFEKEYFGISVSAYSVSNIQKKTAGGLIYRDAFGLTITNLFILNEIDNVSASFGFNTALACDCRDEKIIYPNPIDRIEILMFDVSTEELVNVTDRFGIYGYGGELIELDLLFSNREDWHDVFQLELVDYLSIPNQVYFTVEQYLVSGDVLKATTSMITFTNREI